VRLVSPTFPYWDRQRRCRFSRRLHLILFSVFVPSVLSRAGLDSAHILFLTRPLHTEAFWCAIRLPYPLTVRSPTTREVLVRSLRLTLLLKFILTVMLHVGLDSDRVLRSPHSSHAEAFRPAIRLRYLPASRTTNGTSFFRILSMHGSHKLSAAYCY
jgi:hypothetical protein